MDHVKRSDADSLTRERGGAVEGATDDDGRVEGRVEGVEGSVGGLGDQWAVGRM